MIGGDAGDNSDSIGTEPLTMTESDRESETHQSDDNNT